VHVEPSSVTSEFRQTDQSLICSRVEGNHPKTVSFAVTLTPRNELLLVGFGTSAFEIASPQRLLSWLIARMAFLGPEQQFTGRWVKGARAISSTGVKLNRA